MNGARNGAPKFVPAYRMPHGFGTLMFMRKRDYVPIPDELLVLAGDDWLFQQQTRRNLQIIGTSIGTQWSLTAGDRSCDEQKRQDQILLQEKYQSQAYAERYRLEMNTSYALRDGYRSARSLEQLLRRRTGLRAANRDEGDPRG